MHAPTLNVDLTAIRANYRLLKARHSQQSCAAVVKANAYGLGAYAVAQALKQEGCREYFVATLAEAIELRAVLPDAIIGVFNGPYLGEEAEYLQHNLLPVLNETSQLERWQAASDSAPAILHVDTGMTRLGFSQSMLEKAAATHSEFLAKRVALLMSHLACANEPEHPQNAQQLSRFTQAKTLLPGIRASLCNSSGLFLDARFHQDLARPGCALYGINPTEQENPMQQVAVLSAPIIQIRQLDRDESVGYGGTYPSAKGGKIAITALGYADGWLRSQSNSGFAFIAGKQVPIAGRVSMDMIALDVTPLTENELSKTENVEFINNIQTVDMVAGLCSTIGYEIFTRLGRRVLRTYKNQ